MAQFMVEMPHTREQCMEALDEIAQNPELLAKTEWGCMAGNHNGWAVVEAPSESDIRNIAPAALRDQLQITEVQKLSAEQLKSMHEMAA